MKCTNPHEWNIGAAIIVFSRAFRGIIASNAAAGSSERGCERAAPFGVPVVPDVRMIALPRSAGGIEVGDVAGPDQVLQPRVVRRALLGVVPRDVALAAPRRVVHQLFELVVVDQRLRLLALGDVGELRARERGVEEQHVRAQLRARDHGVDEAAMVAAHQADVVTGRDPVGGERVRECVGALVDLAEGERAELVDDRRLAAVALGRRAVAAGRGRAEAQQRADGADDVVGPARVEHARAGQRTRGEQLGGDLVGDAAEIPGHGPHAFTRTAIACRQAASRRRSGAGSQPRGAG